MAENGGKARCQQRCWGGGGLIGLLVFGSVLAFTAIPALGAILVGAVLGVLCGVVLSHFFCQPVPAIPARAAGAAKTPPEAEAKDDDHVEAAPKADDTDDKAPPAGTGEGAALTGAEPGEAEAEWPRPEPEEAEPERLAAGQDSPAAVSAAATPMIDPGPVEDLSRAPPETPEPDELLNPSSARGTPEAAIGNAAAPEAAGPAASGAAKEGSKPPTLAAARDGRPDDFQQIKGIGPKLEQQLHQMGFWHYDQIANWTEREIAWIDQNLEGIKGRASRDDWVGQARALARGGADER